jgi:hypothetical protein
MTRRTRIPRGRLGDHRHPGRRVQRLVLAALLAVLSSGCTGVDVDGGGGGGGGAVTPLTPQQAMLLAEVLHRNHEAGGARFALTAFDDATGATITLEGAIDWTQLQGRASVRGYRDASGAVTEVAWVSDAVAEQRPDLLALLLEQGEPPGTFVLRSPDPQRGGLDRLLAIVTALATRQPDNAQLVLQNPGAGLLRTDTLRGVDVEVLRYSERSVSWIDPRTGQLLRFEATDARGGNPVIVDILEVGPQQVELPPATTLPLHGAPALDSAR